MNFCTAEFFHRWQRVALPRLWLQLHYPKPLLEAVESGLDETESGAT